MSDKKPPSGLYDVGYKKPPAETKFKKGETGNPRGRPKGSRNLSTLINQIARRKIDVQDNGRTRRITIAEAMLTKLLSKALAGDAASLRLAASLMSTSQGDAGAAPNLFNSEADRALLREALLDLEADADGKDVSAKRKRVRSRKGGQ